MITTTGQTTTRRTETRCPVCRGLECLCRPRFFAGQLLTEEDLNRLENYIIGKNKLHNRYLHGWGVVCGLEVLCNRCDGYVTVRSGYALAPCGDDIVVCEEIAVNVCDLINRCRNQRDWDCDPAWPDPNPICGDQDQQWVLYICYDEKPSRGITSLSGSSGAPCCSRCSCGGSSGCGCGCHEHSSVSGKNGCRSPKPKTPAQCEPTVTCEGYSFQLRKLGIEQERDPGVFISKIRECLSELVKIRTLLNGLSNSNKPLQDVLAIREELIRMLDDHGIFDCKLYERINQSPLPDAAVSILVVQQYFKAILMELLQACICSALLPSCPPPAEDNCVPLATLTINCKSGGCHIVRVCNWEHRRLAVGFPTLEYWLEALFVQSGLSNILERLCCEPLIRTPVETGTFEGGLDQTPTGAGPTVVDDLVVNLLDEATAKNGSVKRSFVYKQIGEIVAGLLAKLFKDK